MPPDTIEVHRDIVPAKPEQGGKGCRRLAPARQRPLLLLLSGCHILRQLAGAKPKSRPQFGMLDRKTHAVLFQQAMDGAGVQRILWAAKTSKAIVQTGWRLQIFDPQTKKLDDLPTPMGVSSVDGKGDGILWIGGGKTLLKFSIDDRKAQSFTSPAAIDHLCVDQNGRVFFASGTELYRFAP